MKSDTIKIDSKGNGFADAVLETQKAAQFRGLNHKDSVQLQLLTEEMLSLARSVTGEMEASFWLESEGKSFDLCMTTKTVMDQEKRYQLISSATSRKNEAANSFLGKLRDSFEQAMLAEAESMNEVPDDAINDVYNRFIDETEWDQYEQSILSRLADNVKIAIKGKTVKMTVSKQFAE